MEIKGLEKCPERTIVVLGTFDGLHRGHQNLINEGRELAKKKGARLAIMTFNEHPETVLKANAVKLLTIKIEKFALLEKLGIEIVFIPSFYDLANYTAVRFFNDILLAKFNAVGIVAGPDFHFGKKAHGNSNLLYFLGKKNQVPVVISPAIEHNQGIISSTLIRRLLNQGQILKANTLLGRRYSLSGKVILGEGRGRTLKMPTANLEVANEKLIPSCGVYLVEGFWGRKSAYGLLSISNKPTFRQDIDIAVEVYFLDLDANLYGKEIKLEFIKYLRGIVKYNSALELRDQVGLDEQKARYFIKHYLNG